jgi:mono/diheme cytochrome c family protein
VTAARVLTALALGAAVALAGCRGDRSDDPPRRFFPSLDEQQKWDPQEETTMFADGRVSRQPAAGTVPFGWTDLPDDPRREEFLREDPNVYLGVGAGGEYLPTAPIAKLVSGPATPGAVEEIVQLGQKKYDIYCLPCHGGTGRGDGITGKRWSYPLPNFHDAQYQQGGEKGQDGYIFHVIRNGVANAPGQLPALRMPAYAERVSEREAWAIVLYIRALQRSQAAGIEDVPESERERLRRTRGATTSPEAAADPMNTEGGTS